MPTGYTAELMEKGETFESFALHCARAFGATILMRDDPMDKPIPEKFEPTDYHVKAIANARATLRQLEEMGGTARLEYGARQREAEIKSRREYLARDRDQDARLESMRLQVIAWTPPTSEHQGLKDFMLDQIKISRHGNWSVKYLAEAEGKSPAEYFALALQKARADITYHTDENIKEVERTNSRNEWIAALRRSLR